MGYRLICILNFDLSSMYWTSVPGPGKHKVEKLQDQILIFKIFLTINIPVKCIVIAAAIS
jgi:hypothetical protein